MQEYTVTVDDRGGIYWYQNGKLHREGGPAWTTPDGTKYWYKQGLWHRLDGPAIEYPKGANSWYIDGFCMTEADFLERTQPAKEMTVEEISKLLGYDVKVVKG